MSVCEGCDGGGGGGGAVGMGQSPMTEPRPVLFFLKLLPLKAVRMRLVVELAMDVVGLVLAPASHVGALAEVFR